MKNFLLVFAVLGSLSISSHAQAQVASPPLYGQESVWYLDYTLPDLPCCSPCDAAPTENCGDFIQDEDSSVCFALTDPSVDLPALYRCENFPDELCSPCGEVDSK